MVQAILKSATDKPGDLPVSIFGTAEGCVTKKACHGLCLRPSSVVIYSLSCAGGAEVIHEKNSL
jgi:hypothetical protein